MVLVLETVGVCMIVVMVGSSWVGVSTVLAHSNIIAIINQPNKKKVKSNNMIIDRTANDTH